MPTAAETVIPRKRKGSAVSPMPWWGDRGPAPHVQWPKRTVEIPAVWSTARSRWESPDGRFYFDEAAADRAERFFSDMLVHHIGEFAGQPFVLMEYQRKLLTRPLFGWKRAQSGIRRFSKLFAFLPKGAGKALALDTAVPTPDGWKTMGELAAGDHVFDERGNPCLVKAATEVMLGRDCYRVTFSDGAAIVADAGHGWLTESRRGGGPAIAIRTTCEIAETLRNSNGAYQSANHSVALAEPLRLPDITLPVEPYALGVWLGDGDSDCARVTLNENDAEEMTGYLAATGTDCGTAIPKKGAVRIRIGSAGKTGPAGAASMNAALRRIGLLKNKHIPAEYLRAGTEQRWALLQGLMDTDGHIDRKGACEYCSTDKPLAEGSLELILSLGIKATMRESDAVLNGRVVGRRWRINFKPGPDLPVFRIARKRALQKWGHSRRALSRDRRITACDPIESVPVKCITVSSESGMYLAGREMIPTHNSPWGAGTALYTMGFDEEPAAEVYVVAADREQARVVHDNAKVMVEGNEELAEYFEIQRDAIFHRGSRSTLKVLSSDASTKHGFRPHVVILDEMHAQKNRDLYEALRKSMAKRRQPIMGMITHSGVDDEGICFEEYEYAKGVLTGSIDDPSTLPVIFEMQPDDDWTDPAVWAATNPGHGITIKHDAIEQECQEAMVEPRKRNDFLRYHLNVWTNQAEAWMPGEWWDRCPSPLPSDDVLRGLDLAAGFDMAQKIDLASLVLTFKEPLESPPLPVAVTADNPMGVVEKREVSLNYRIHVLPMFWIDEETMRERELRDRVPYSEWANHGWVTVTEGNVIDDDRIFKDIVKLADRFPKLRESEIGYDPAFATSLALRLLANGFKAVEVPQNYRHMSEPCHVLEAMTRAGRVTHDGNRCMRRCVENVAIKTDDAGRIRPVKPKKQAKRIDGVVAALMGLGRLIANAEKGSEPQFFVLGGTHGR